MSLAAIDCSADRTDVLDVAWFRFTSVDALKRRVIAAKALSVRGELGPDGPGPVCTDDRCQLEPRSCSRTALTRPAWSSLTASRTPRWPRPTKERMNPGQAEPSSFPGLSSTPSTRRSPVAAKGTATRAASDATLPPSRTLRHAASSQTHGWATSPSGRPRKAATSPSSSAQTRLTSLRLIPSMPSANGGDVFSLQRILGHSPASLQVTRRYVRLLDDDIRAVHRRVSPVDRL